MMLSGGHGNLSEAGLDRVTKVVQHCDTFLHIMTPETHQMHPFIATLVLRVQDGPASHPVEGYHDDVDTRGIGKTI